MENLLSFIIDRGAVILLRAAIVLVPLFVVFWIWKPVALQKFRIPQPKKVEPRHLTDFLLTLMGLLVYLIPIFTLGFLQKKYGYSVFYSDISKYGYAYFVFTIFYCMFVVDTWFYWSHRLMHKVKFLKKAHSVHHKSYNVTPLTSYSFGFVESILNMSSFFIITLTIPMHPLALLIFSMLGIATLGYIHLGYDFFYDYRSRHPILKWHYTSTHHSLHHQFYDGNYGVYFTFWDKIMKTEIIVKKTDVASEG